MISVVFLHLQGLIRFLIWLSLSFCLYAKLTSTNTGSWLRPMNDRDFTNRDFNPPEADCGFPGAGNLIDPLCCSRARRGERVRTPKAFGVATESSCVF